MKRIRFPVALWHQEPVVAFRATREVFDPLGSPGFIETDELATHGGREFFWAFEQDGIRLCVEWHENYDQARVAADPPDPEQIVAFLRNLGIDAEFTVLPPPQPPVVMDKRVAIGAVWVFTADLATDPTVVFTTKQRADEWIAHTGASGALSVYPLNKARQEYVVGWLQAFRQGFPNAAVGIDDVGEAYEYEAGKQCPDGGMWLVVRQDDNGVRAVVDEFGNRREAVVLQRRLEAAGHKQTYWVEHHDE